MSRCNPFAIARQTKNDIVKGLGKVYEDLAANATDDDNNNNGKSCCSKCEACNQLRTVMKQPDANRLPGNNSGMYKCTPWGEKKIKQKEIMALGGEEGIALGAERDHIKQKYETSYPSGIEHKVTRIKCSCGQWLQQEEQIVCSRCGEIFHYECCTLKKFGNELKWICITCKQLNRSEFENYTQEIDKNVLCEKLSFQSKKLCKDKQSNSQTVKEAPARYSHADCTRQSLPSRAICTNKKSKASISRIDCLAQDLSKLSKAFNNFYQILECLKKNNIYCQEENERNRINMRILENELRCTRRAQHRMISTLDCIANKLNDKIKTSFSVNQKGTKEHRKKITDTSETDLMKDNTSNTKLRGNTSKIKAFRQRSASTKNRVSVTKIPSQSSFKMLSTDTSEEHDSSKRNGSIVSLKGNTSKLSSLPKTKQVKERSRPIIPIIKKSNSNNMKKGLNKNQKWNQKPEIRDDQKNEKINSLKEEETLDSETSDRSTVPKKHSVKRLADKSTSCDEMDNEKSSRQENQKSTKRSPSKASLQTSVQSPQIVSSKSNETFPKEKRNEIISTSASDETENEKKCIQESQNTPKSKVSLQTSVQSPQIVSSKSNETSPKEERNEIISTSACDETENEKKCIQESQRISVSSSSTIINPPSIHSRDIASNASILTSIEEENKLAKRSCTNELCSLDCRCHKTRGSILSQTELQLSTNNLQILNHSSVCAGSLQESQETSRTSYSKASVHPSVCTQEIARSGPASTSKEAHEENLASYEETDIEKRSLQEIHNTSMGCSSGTAFPPSLDSREVASVMPDSTSTEVSCNNECCSLNCVCPKTTIGSISSQTTFHLSICSPILANYVPVTSTDETDNATLSQKESHSSNIQQSLQPSDGGKIFVKSCSEKESILQRKPERFRTEKPLVTAENLKVDVKCVEVSTASSEALKDQARTSSGEVRSSILKSIPNEAVQYVEKTSSLNEDDETGGQEIQDKKKVLQLSINVDKETDQEDCNNDVPNISSNIEVNSSTKPSSSVYEELKIKTSVQIVDTDVLNERNKEFDCHSRTINYKLASPDSRQSEANLHVSVTLEMLQSNEKNPNSVSIANSSSQSKNSIVSSILSPLVEEIFKVIILPKILADEFTVSDDTLECGSSDGNVSKSSERVNTKRSFTVNIQEKCSHSTLCNCSVMEETESTTLIKVSTQSFKQEQKSGESLFSSHSDCFQ